MKIAFIIGHNQKNQGYYSEELETSEWDFYSKMTCDLEEIGDVFIHDSTIIGYTDRCKDISKRIGTEYDLTIALHFNSYDTTVGGTECYYWHTNDQTKKIATWLTKRFSGFIGTDNRGAKPFDSVDDRGAGEVYYPKGNAILFEPFFGDNKEDCEKFDIYRFLLTLERLTLEFRK